SAFDPDDLFDPELNLRMGAWYLRALLDQFDGRPVVALAAYNAGRTRVQEWLAQGRWDGREETLDDTPFGETRHHVRRVLTTLETYRWLGDGSWHHASADLKRLWIRLPYGRALRGLETCNGASREQLARRRPRPVSLGHP